MPLVRANGLDVGYSVEGEGPPLILLHGASSSAVEDWGHQRALFRQSFTCYLVDARGHAATFWDGSGDWTRDALVEDLGAFADALGLGTFHVAGFSMGAMTALTFATRDPERARELLDGLEVDYVEIAPFDPPVLAAAIHVGSTRLIDNVPLIHVEPQEAS